MKPLTFPTDALVKAALATLLRAEEAYRDQLCKQAIGIAREYIEWAQAQPKDPQRYWPLVLTSRMVGKEKGTLEVTWQLRHFTNGKPRLEYLKKGATTHGYNTTTLLKHCPVEWAPVVERTERSLTVIRGQLQILRKVRRALQQLDDYRAKEHDRLL